MPVAEQTIASKLTKYEQARIEWKRGFRGADSYLVNLFKEGKLNGEYELQPLGCDYKIKGKFEMANDLLYFERGEVDNNFTRESVVALAESLGYIVPFFS